MPHVAGLETGLIQEREHVEFSEPVDILDEIVMESTHPDQIAIAVTHEEVVFVPVWMSRGHDGDAEGTALYPATGWENSGCVGVALGVPAPSRFLVT